MSMETAVTNRSTWLAALALLVLTSSCATGAHTFGHDSCQREYDACTSSCATRCEPHYYGGEEDHLSQSGQNPSGANSGECMQCLEACRDVGAQCDERMEAQAQP